MNKRRRLTPQERGEVDAEKRIQNPGKQVFVQEWTDADGNPIVVMIQHP